MSAVWSLTGEKRTLQGHRQTVENDPSETSGLISSYYNDIRTHRSLDKDAPVSRQIQRIGSIKSRAILGGLHNHYARA